MQICVETKTFYEYLKGGYAMTTRKKFEKVTINSVLGAAGIVVLLLVLLYYNLLILITPFNEMSVERFVTNNKEIVQENTEIIPGIETIDIDHWIVKKFIDLPGIFKVFWWFICFLYAFSFFIAIPTSLVFLFEPHKGPLGWWNKVIFGKE